MKTIYKILVAFTIFQAVLTATNFLIAQSITSSMDTLYYWVNSNQSIEGKVLNLPHIQYETNSHQLTPDSKMSIDTLVMGLQEVSNIAISIGGHTDDVGEDRYNLELSEKRAESVFNYLVEKGVEADRLQYRGFGKSNPLVPNSSAANRALNRRVEIILKLRDDIQVEQVSQSIYLNSGRIIPVKEYTIEESNLSYIQYGSTNRYTEPLSNVQYIVGTDGARKYENPMNNFSEVASQPTPTPVVAPKAPANPNHYSGYYIGVGMRSTNIETAVMALNYIDDSPSRDSFSGEKELKEQEYGISFEFGIQGGNLRGGHFELGGSGITGSVNFLAFHMAYGYNFSLGQSNKSFLRPVLGVEFGRAKSRIGDITNNDLFIRVDNTDFYSDKVSIKVISNQGTLKPRIDFGIPFSGTDNHSILTFTAGYSYNIYSNEPMIKFTGSDGNQEPLRATERIDEENVDFSLNGVRSTTQLPFNLNGPFVGIGFKF
jgi:outer membrane protein OmpA-like peptidoglycan-associated protein